jgi:hypothetical protein
LEEAEAKERELSGKGEDGSGGRGNKKTLRNDSSGKRAPQSRDKVGAFAGYSGRTMEKIA